MTMLDDQLDELDEVRPALVGLARGVAEAAALAVIVAVYAAISGGELELPAQLSPLALLGLRTLEGAADERIDPTKRRGKLGKTLAGKTAP